MISRRQTLGLFGAAAATALLPGIKGARAAATEFRIGWQKNGVLALAKRRGALEKRLADRGITVSWSEFTSGPPLLEALGAGALDFGATGDVPRFSRRPPVVTSTMLDFIEAARPARRSLSGRTRRSSRWKI